MNLGATLCGTTYRFRDVKDADLAYVLNRISSALYLCACKYVAGRYEGTRRLLGPVRGWRPPATGKNEETS